MKEQEILASLGSVTPEAIRFKVLLEESRAMREDIQRLSMLIENMPCSKWNDKP